MRLFYIRQLVDLSWDTGYSEAFTNFPQSLEANTGKLPQIEALLFFSLLANHPVIRPHIIWLN
jgi:hypothetical protein